jgi:UDP-glucose:(heptosyl)LPS alpha-1,3-glucosyltransferase
MRIALTVGSFNTLGGIERVTVQLARAYRGLGHDVTVVATDWDPALAEGFEMVRVAAPARPAWLRTLNLHQAVDAATRGRTFDFIHAQGTSAMHMDLLTFHSVHAAWLEVSARQGLGWLKRMYPFHRAAIAIERRQVASHRGMIHACSDEVREEVIRYYGADPARVVSIPWGIDPSFFADPVAHEDTVVILVANEFKRKGLATIIEALALLADPRLKLVVAGRDDATPYRALAQQLGVRAEFVGHVQVGPYYQAADVFVMPSTYEGWGLVLGEAMAAGLPVVTSHFPGSDAMVEAGVNGLFVEDPRDPAELARAIAAVLPHRETWGRAARETARRYDWTAVAERLLALRQARW